MTASRFERGPVDSPGFLLWRATMRWQRLMATTLAPLGLTHVQFVLLACTWWLTEAGEAPTQARLAAQAGIEVRMTSDVLRRLEAKGLLQRTRSARDPRANVVRLTSAGAASTAAALSEVERADASHFAAITDGQDLVAALRVLAGVSQSEGFDETGA